jgi:hypothetical protein
MWKTAVSLVALALLAPDTPQQSPRSLLAAADTGPVAFVEALASNRLAAGLVARESVFQIEQAREMVPRAGDENTRDAIARFNSQAHGYSAASEDGVTLLRPGSIPVHVRDLLQRRLRPVGATQSVQDTLMEITKLLEPNWGESGVIGTGPMPPRECQELLDRGVTLAAPASLQDLLGSVARQSPGVAWMLLYDEWDSSSVKLGLVCPNGTWRRWTIVPSRPVK